MSSTMQAEEPVEASDEAFGIGWWNTSLALNGGNRVPTDSDRGIAASIFISLVERGCYLIALCEVSEFEVGKIKELLGPEVLAVYEFTEAGVPAGKGRYDTCVAYRKDFVSVVSRTELNASLGGQKFRAAQYFLLDICAEGVPLHLFLSHWPSRMHMPSDSSTRILLGSEIHRKFEEIRGLDIDPQVVMLGDYNDEPFDRSISESLLATRDRDLALNKEHLLYNPFWRHMSFYEHGGEDGVYDRGTYYYKSGVNNRWYTFDQMMFSKALMVGSRRWMLSEADCRVVKDSDLLKLVVSNKNKFDHLPIISKLVRSDSHG